MTGKAALDITKSWIKFVELTLHAVTDENLEEAARELVKALKETTVEGGNVAIGAMMGGALGRLNRLRKATAPKKAHIKTADGEYWVSTHGDFRPRPSEIQSHHGAMSAWSKKHLPGYDPERAPTIFMPKSQHEKTFGVYNKWRAEMTKKMGGTFDWAKVSEADMRILSQRQLDAANVPESVRAQFWADFEKMKKALGK